MKQFLIAITFLLTIPMMLFAQTYSSLWKQVSEAEDQDLPKTEQELLRKIAQKAEAEGNYAQLLKAELREGRSLCSVSPDSLAPAVERLKQREQQAQDSVLRAVYNAVLGYIYANNSFLDPDNYHQISEDYYTRALAHPDLLAATKTNTYDLIVTKGNDSRIYDDDMLSVIGYEARRFDVLRNYYITSNNRRAALLSSLMWLKQQRPTEVEPLNKSEYLERLDSLVAEYGDLPEAGEVAIERYDYMERQTNATAEQKMLYLNEAIGRWGSWQRMNELRNSQRDLTSLYYRAYVEESVVAPGMGQEVRVEGLRGVNSLTMRIFRVKTDGQTYWEPERQDGYNKLKPLLTALPALTTTRTYVGKAAYEVFQDSLQLPALPVGVYMVEMETNPSTRVSRQMLYVTGVRLIAQGLPKRQVRFVVVDAVSGQPLPKAKIEITSSEGYYSEKKTFKLTADERGEAMYTRPEKERTCKVVVTTSTDNACPSMNADGTYSYYAGSRESSKALVYTDRQIYRPGQTVQAAAILYTTHDYINNKVDAGRSVTMQLRDANDQVVDEKKVTTDQYGTCTALLTIPTKGLTGQFTVKANTASHIIRVEEYKRPSFEVEMPAVTMGYEDGDTVVAKGVARSYAGVPVPGAKVKYKVFRRRAYWWMTYFSYWQQAYVGSGSEDAKLAEGETVTDDSGVFAVDVPIVVPKTRYPMFYNFTVVADVTDQAGETHQGSLSLPMGNRVTAFSCTLPEKVLNDEETTMTFHRQNAAGIEMEGRVRYRFDKTGRWLEAATNELITLPKMKSGSHTLQAICEKDTVEHSFIVFALDDRQPAEQTDDWFYASDHRFPTDGTPVTVQVGSSEKNVHIVYAVYTGNTVLESGAVERSNELLNRKFDYREDYGNGLLLTYAWVKNGKVYRHRATIQRPLPDKHLKLQWQTFRNRLTPGQQEEWTVSVTTPDGQPADAQLMATLYDKSLDQLAEHSWSLSPTPWLGLPSTVWQIGTWGGLDFSGHKHAGMLNVSGLNFTRFNHELYPARWVVHYRMARLNAMGGRLKGREPDLMAPVMMEEKVFDVVEQMPSFKAAADEAVETEDEVDAGGAAAEKVQVRENLSETAFFYPQLTTDSEGRVAIRFTLPESLTTWRFMSIAHTKDMMYGSLFDEAVAKKDVMIQPNMPRFVRQGDQATITARLFNTGENAVSGVARLQLLDPETEKVVYEQHENVTLQAGAGSSVSFKLQPQAAWTQYTLLIARTTIEAHVATRSNVQSSMVNVQYSDGEQHYLPVLPDREHVTVTVPFTQHEPGTKTIDLTKVVPADATQAQLTFEYTNNPAWLLVQALPAIGHPNDECAVCQAASFYANAIGQHIIDQNPQAKTVFEQWSREQGAETSLMSSLEKNQELKDLVLGETPWVLDAKNEDDQKQRLADFFDQNLMQQRLNSAIDKVKALQRPDGSWSWWPDMRGSWYMTVSISQMFVRLQQMVPMSKNSSKAAVENSSLFTFHSSLDKMLNRSFKFMGNEAVDLVNEMKRAEKEYGVKPTFPSHTTLEWLYLCTLDGRKLPSKVQEANSYLIKLLKKEIKNQSIYDKAMTAIILDNKTYVKSLKEYTVYREDMGRYYDTDRALYSWRDYRIPTQVAAIEALKRLTPADTQTIEEMQRWLLQEKRTQAWDTPLNSVDAIYAFLDGNAQALAAQEKSVLSVDGKQLDTPAATAGIGYVKTSQAAEGAKTFTAEKTSTGTSWGAVYAQFMQHTANITDQQSGIKVTREVWFENSKMEMEGSAAPANVQRSTFNVQRSMFNVQCKVGDRVKVRIIIEADRDYDFVQVIDKRAACMEPVKQLSGYGWGYYCTPRDCATNYYFDLLSKGRHVIETEYYIDRPGTYETGTCTASCAYSPEFRGMTRSMTITVEP